MKKKIFIIGFILILSIFTISCSKVDQIDINTKDENDLKENDIVEVKDELNIALTKVVTLDPLENTKMDYDNFIELVYDSLFEIDEDFQVLPLLVDSYNISHEGRTIEILLKDGIYWHNGKSLTTEDIAFSIEKLKENKDGSIYKDRINSALGSFNKINIKNVIKTEIIDERRMEISFDKNYSNTLEILTFPIVSKDSYNIDGGYTPIGTGPYIYKDYNSSQAITLIKNNNYWNGPVNISRINGKIFENEDMILSAFEDGRVDLLNSMEVDIEKYKKNPHIDTIEYVSSEYEFLAYNFKNNLLNGQDGKKIRKAIYYGIDRQKIIREIYVGHATQVDTPLHPNSYLTDNVVNSYGYSPENAKELLKDAGFKDLDIDGVLKDQLGRRLEFTLITNSSNPYRREMASIIKESLKEVGISIILDHPGVDLDNLNNEELDKEWANLTRTLNNGKYDLAILGWELSVIPDMSFMFHSSFKNKDTNFIGYKDEKMDKLLEEIYFNDREDKTDMAESLQKYVMEEIPYASLFFKNRVLLINNSLKGPLKPRFFNPYKNIEKCKILG